MLTLIVVMAIAHATPCEDYAPPPYDGKECDPATPGTTICGTNNTGVFHLECDLQGAHLDTNTSATAVYVDASDEYYIYGVNGDGDAFCCDNDTVGDDVYGAWDGVYSEWYGADDTSHYDSIDLSGWTGDTFISVDAGNDRIWGVNDSAFEDTVYGGAGSDYVKGNAGHDVINGEAGTDHLCGDGDGDSIYGGSENDNIYGGTGQDLMNGGTGTNRCENQTGKPTPVACTGPVLTACDW